MTNQNKVNMFHFSGELFRALSLKMKVLITVVFSSLIVLSVMLLSFSDNFKHQVLDTTINYPWESETQGDRLIGGLLTEDFNERSCLSRYHKSLLYRKPSPYTPSEYLVSKIRSYEMLHKRCGPETQAYKEATETLSHDETNYANKSSGECKYVVWLADYGLGNRMLTLASVFLYALLTERIILIDQRKDVSDLFCEPFPGTSWLLPLDFPLMNKADGYNKGYSRCYGKMVEDQTINSTSIPRHLYLHMLHDSRETDKLFVCQKYHSLIDKVPWLIFRANVYFVPSLWFNPTFNEELTKLFPQKETTFHHLARYLFHPTNRVWDIITSYYNDHLSKADERLGIQIRVFSSNAGYLQYVMDQVISCTTSEKLLPELDLSQEESKVNVSKRPKLKAVLVTSLYPEYSEKLRNMTLELPSSTRDVIKVYQPSGERFQQTDKAFHDQKALAEMYLLSLTDNIVASARSTFGYVAYSLAGLKPWLLYMPANHSAPDPPCVRAASTEPCFLTPLGHGCAAEWSWRTLPFVKQCEDNFGLKLFDEL